MRLWVYENYRFALYAPFYAAHTVGSYATFARRETSLLAPRATAAHGQGDLSDAVMDPYSVCTGDRGGHRVVLPTLDPGVLIGAVARCQAQLVWGGDPNLRRGLVSSGFIRQPVAYAACVDNNLARQVIAERSG
jgi:hypothetical protein